jgi:NAD(P)-dependent dehydrogenase (short-subunit alcohol dehydrogenase family)
MEIILLGCDGLIGRYLRKRLQDGGHIVHGYDLQSGIDFTSENSLEYIFNLHTLADCLICTFAIDSKIGSGMGGENMVQSSLANFLKVNIESTYNSARMFIDSRASGRIVLFSSIYSLVSPDHRLYNKIEKHEGYAITKAAINMLVKQLAVKHPSFLINCISPGGIATESVDKEFASSYSERCPLGRMMRVSEIYPAVKFLLDKENTYTTGSNLVCDGGWTCI